MQLPPAPQQHRSHAWIWASVLSVIAIFGVVAGALHTNAQPPGMESPAIERPIQTLAPAASCSELQEQFDFADWAHDHELERGNLDGAEKWADEMSRLDAQMRSSGCYG